MRQQFTREEANAKRNAPSAKEKSEIKSLERALKIQEETGEAALGLEPKQSVSIRLEPALVEWFRNNSRHYQTHMRRVLKSYAATQKMRMLKGEDIQIEA